MRENILVAVLLVAGVGSFAFASDDRCPSSADAVPLCTILSDAAKYDGKEITVRGLYGMVLHGSILTSPACGNTKVNMRQASDYKADRHAVAVMRSLTKKDQFQLLDVVIRGTFRVARHGECFGQNCLAYEIESHELLCAKTPGDSNDSPGGKEPKGTGSATMR